MVVSPKPNLQLVYVSNIERSTAFYKNLFKTDPVFTSPRYVAFPAGAETLFAIWSGATSPDIDAPRFSEVGIMLPTNDDVDQLYNQWKDDNGIKILQPPTTEVFGRTFLVQDPDGHIIRVSPVN